MRKLPVPLRPLLALLFIIISGCASKETGPLLLYPAPVKDPRYSIDTRAAVFENGLIRVSARPVSKSENLPALLKKLLKEDYKIFVMDIENLSEKKVMYNPSRTALMDNALGYRKPLDYTDLYMSERDRDVSLLEPLKGRFYDLDVTLGPGERVSRFIIFRPLTEGSTKAVLVLKALYIGMDTVDIKLPFVLEPEEGL